MRAAARLLAWAPLLAALLSGCASTPQASNERDAEAKQFLTHPGTATLYVYRDDFPTGGMSTQDSDLYVDRRLIGATLSRTYFRLDLRPGTHLLNGYAFDQGQLKIETRPDQIYFVSLTVTDGYSSFVVVDAEKGKRDILRCCTLMDNWGPGQPRLLW